MKYFMRLMLLILLFCGGSWMGFRFYEAGMRQGCFLLQEDVLETTSSWETAETVQWIALGDTGTGSEDQKAVAQAIHTVCDRAGCDFLLFLGDNFYENGVSGVQDAQWTTKFEDIYGFLNKPVWAVVGNHDMRTNPLSQVMYSLKNSQWRMPNLSYTFTAGPVQFFAVHTECHAWGWRWLSQQLSRVKSSDRWNVLYTHHPIYSSGVHGDTDWLMRQLWQGWVEEKIDFYLSGHDHELEHLQIPGDATDYIVSGAGAKHYRSDEMRSQTKTSQAMSRFVYQDTGFVWFSATRQEVTAVFYDAQGHPLYQFTKQKNL